MMQNEYEDIDLVIPVFNELLSLPSLIEHIGVVLSGTFTKINIILVDDGSTDNTEDALSYLKGKTGGVDIKYIKFTKNFGKDMAIKCGIDHSTSGLCAIIDADFQHPPEKIIDGLEKIKQGYNIVHFEKEEYTGGSVFRKACSSVFRKFLGFFSDREVNLSDFKLIDAKVTGIIKGFKEANYFNRGVMHIIGLKAATVLYRPLQRKFGVSKYSFVKLLGLSVEGLISVSNKPLRLSISIGMIMSIISLCYGVFLVLEKFMLGQAIAGFTTLGAAIFFLGGVQLIFLGIIGEYIGRIFIESKGRPQYIIDYIKEI
jgi:dolichol-phosphate mannosyltransferase